MAYGLISYGEKEKRATGDKRCSLRLSRRVANLPGIGNIFLRTPFLPHRLLLIVLLPSCKNPGYSR